MSCGNDELHFFYDAQGRPTKVKFNGTMYTYVHNLQGDIVGILDGNRALVIEYKYDAWGMPLSISGSMAETLGAVNPFRYRGYVYDPETELYYLRSRYYSARINRFILSDCLFVSNQFSYSDNEPIYYYDPDGLYEIAAAVIGGGLTASGIYTTDGVLARTMFIGGTGKAKTSLPAGTYIIKDGTGKNWFGEEEAFGSEGYYEIMTFGDGQQEVQLKKNYSSTITVNVQENNPDAEGVGSNWESWSDF